MSQLLETQWVAAEEWRALAQRLHGEGWLLASLCGVDRLHIDPETRFEIVANLIHHERRARVMVHVAADGDVPTVPSVTDLWPGANFMEREAFDMFGIHFDGHPNLTRILMPDEWQGHPLRKDYGVGKVPVEFIPQPFLQIDAPGQSPKTREAGQDVDRLGQSETRAAESQEGSE